MIAPTRVEKAFLRAADLLTPREGARMIRYTQVSYDRLMARDAEFYRQLARDASLSTTLSEDLLFRQMVQERNEEWRKGASREEHHFLRSCAQALLDSLPYFPPSSRSILVLRLQRRTWRDILAKHPGRVLFSLREDYHRDLEIHGSRYSREVDVLS